MAKPPRPPKTVEEATVLLDRFSTLAGKLADIEAERSAAIASTNAVSDTLASPVLEEQKLLLEQLQPWWAKAKDQLTGGKRKSLELGGCMIGTRSSSASLQHSLASDDLALAALKAERWAKPYVRVTYSIDRAMVRVGLKGRHKEQLTALGFSEKPSTETFYVERVAQSGTQADVAAKR